MGINKLRLFLWLYGECLLKLIIWVVWNISYLLERREKELDKKYSIGRVIVYVIGNEEWFKILRD